MPSLVTACCVHVRTVRHHCMLQVCDHQPCHIILVFVSCLAVVPAGSYMQFPTIVAVCPTGQYKDVVGADAPCTSCPTGVTTPKEGSTSAANCTGGCTSSQQHWIASSSKDCVYIRHAGVTDEVCASHGSSSCTQAVRCIQFACANTQHVMRLLTPLFLLCIAFQCWWLATTLLLSAMVSSQKPGRVRRNTSVLVASRSAPQTLRSASRRTPHCSCAPPDCGRKRQAQLKPWIAVSRSAPVPFCSPHAWQAQTLPALCIPFGSDCYLLPEIQ